MNPKVSFIIPYFNSGKTIRETIDSIRTQTYPNYDIWIINDGSSDEFSNEILKELETDEKIKILNQENSGPSIARNKAIRESDAAIIVPLDADDLIEKDALSNAIPILLKDDKIGVVYGNFEFFGAENKVKIQQEFQIEQQLLWNQVAACCFIKKEVFKTAGFYDEYLSKPGLEDWEFWIRVYQSGWEFSKIEETQFKVRVNHHSRTFQVANKNIDIIKEYVYKKHSLLLAEEFEKLFYEKKMLAETPDYKIGKLILRPYRIMKKLFRS